MKASITASLAALGLLVTGAVPASAENVYAVSGKVSPAGPGTARSPLPIGVSFSLESRNAEVADRPGSTETYVLRLEGVSTNASAFPACAVTRLSIRKGPASPCAKALIGSGLIQGAAGIVEDQTLEESVPCNLRLRVYNTGKGMALRLDGGPPLPTSFKSTKIGCPVPIHTAIPAPFRRVTIDGRRSTELKFTVPKVLMRPLAGWNSGLTTVKVAVKRIVGQGGRGYFAATGCTGGSRTLEVGFVGVDRERTDAAAQLAC